MRGGYLGTELGGAYQIVSVATEGAGYSLGEAIVTGVGTSVPGPRLEITDTDILQKPVNVMLAESRFRLGDKSQLSKGLFKSIFNE